MYRDQSNHTAYLSINLSNIWNIFSKISAYIGFLDFVYSNDGDKKAKDGHKNTDDDDKNDRLSTVTHFDLSVAFINLINNGLVKSS